MMEYINGWEWLPLVICTIAGFIMVSFTKRVDMAVIGTIVLFMTMILAYETHSNNLDKEYVLKRFTQGKALKCGLWRGESLLVDPKSGWKFEENIGFIKGDQIHNDHGLCSVIGEESPRASDIPYVFALIFELMLAFGLRAVFVNYAEKEEEKDHDTE
ncbi:hypothetical protein [Sulfuricurvum sp.]|uniref:hypothetical protein n=1 Tax=Sulfuricurvum sp. TaxID=2025608 RepID=UPI00263A39F0|nr:hypothetical protein [Sulfuricurvum sp.]MDD2780889.1 hypothetical protein [Sulfuricurvum sp.]MDD3595262.1 hypothetical protein [Sulfuricurvum sp.]